MFVILIDAKKTVNFKSKMHNQLTYLYCSYPGFFELTNINKISPFDVFPLVNQNSDNHPNEITISSYLGTNVSTAVR